MMRGPGPAASGNQGIPPPAQGVPPSGMQNVGPITGQGAPNAGAIGRALGGGSSDQEKVCTSPSTNIGCRLDGLCFQAALIMQVLQLSDEQIALLPPDQRQSIMVLKEQIARSSR